jgi:hypothetical protein
MLPRKMLALSSLDEDKSNPPNNQMAATGHQIHFWNGFRTLRSMSGVKIKKIKDLNNNKNHFLCCTYKNPILIRRFYTIFIVSIFEPTNSQFPSPIFK